ncbi:DUF5602 domain-containing protein [Zeaxanthinibacter enoshimensis]|uniref:TTHB210-like domain-containing protein n=1 Tax=Zeaxanthinibacter enoshimensis TaxID=392009 RepID=A0A4R6TSI8_9FLAO|nr:DUF5602 domain-containing protein [Zeaxanthinibacter enoshimensis]TDQ33143.1 hypothetical protein CLV82_0981 [Zeaxanthinibacter enoshimensis]
MKYLMSLLFVLFLTLACTSDDDPSNPGPGPDPEFSVYKGSAINIGNGKAWSFIRTDKQKRPLSIGIQFDAEALEGLPTGSPHGNEFVLPLPAEIAVAPYDHITMDWNEHGHEPEGVYDVPHFDFHFYFISMAERDAITPDETAKFNEALPARYLAEDYLETEGGVPRMGAHIIDLRSPEIAGTGPFTHTFIYGKYDAEINFLEPMVTVSTLDANVDITQDIRTPAEWQKTGYYPDSYIIFYDEDSGLYELALENLSYQVGTAINN